MTAGEDPAALRSGFARELGMGAEQVRVVRSPYRICPLGAHIDHQLGRVTALAIDRAVHLAFAPLDEPSLRLRSSSFENELEIDFSEVPAAVPGDWGNYARGAIRALQSRFDLRRGFVGHVTGTFAEGGLSSSAAVGVAYLMALEHVNGLTVLPWERIELDRLIENEYLGLRNGVLDQAAIILSRARQLTVIDCARRSHELIPLPISAPDHAWLIAFSGLHQALVSTGYNRRVGECTEAAAILLAAAGHAERQPLLGNVTLEQYAAYGASLDGDLAKRARHFFSESERVDRGIAAWAGGDLHAFGRLMSESGQSSIVNYECGAPPLIDLYEILCETPGVLGARFSGAGFRGCCIALVEAKHAQSAAESVREEYASRQPDLAPDAPVVICRSADGAGIL
jgi:galacturonokinase